MVKSNDKTIESDYLMSEKTIKVEGVDLVTLFGASKRKHNKSYRKNGRDITFQAKI